LHLKGEQLLPKMLYELLPYMYLSIGAGGGAVISSAIVLVASVAFIATGIIVIMMRISYRRKIRSRRSLLSRSS
jgi:hypothetical protein